MHNKGSSRREDICGRERDGVGVRGVNKMDTTGTFRKESREFEGGVLGWIIGGRKDRAFLWGMIRGGGEQVF